MRATPAARNVRYARCIVMTLRSANDMACVTGTKLPRALALALAVGSTACAGEQSATHVFVRDPHQVWVEASSNNGEEVVLPPGEGLRGVRIREGDANTHGILSYATLFREPSGSITVDDRMCAPWPTSPLSAAGELRVLKNAGEAPFVSDGPTVRIPFLCGRPNHTRVELDFVTAWSNVREVHVVKGELSPVAASSTHPALQREDWHE
jgi:hypothetical protein